MRIHEGYRYFEISMPNNLGHICWQGIFWPETNIKPAKKYFVPKTINQPLVMVIVKQETLGKLNIFYEF